MEYNTLVQTPSIKTMDGYIYEYKAQPKRDKCNIITAVSCKQNKYKYTLIQTIYPGKPKIIEFT